MWFAPAMEKARALVDAQACFIVFWSGQTGSWK